MSLVKRDQMTVLRSASESAATAAAAEHDIQLQSVAFLINEAANTGLYRAVYQQEMMAEVKATLESKGYAVKFINNTTYQPHHHALITWGDHNSADSTDEPFMNANVSRIPQFEVEDEEDKEEVSNE